MAFFELFDVFVELEVDVESAAACVAVELVASRAVPVFVVVPLVDPVEVVVGVAVVPPEVLPLLSQSPPPKPRPRPPRPPNPSNTSPCGGTVGFPL